MSSCVFPGSFDPVTNGHMDLITRAAGLFDEVTVAVMVNIHKQGVILPEKRAELIRRACAGLPNVRVEVWQGLLTEFMRLRGERCIIRGARSAGEFDAELASAAANRALLPGVETLFLPASGPYAWVSSSAVREIAAFGGDILSFVPPEAAEEIAQLLANK